MIVKVGGIMKIIMNFTLQKPELVKNYSPAFVSFIKNALSKYDENLFNGIYKSEPDKEKDFCFAVRLDKPKFEPDKITLNSENVQMTMSILSAVEGIDFYNAFLNQKNKSYPFPCGNSITINQVRMENHKPVHSQRVLIKMCSPLLVRKHEADVDTYLAYNDEDFQRCFALSVNRMLNNLVPDVLNTQVEIMPVKPFKTVVNTFGNRITGNIGIYQLNSDAKVIDLLNHLGIGSRRSQGFGMFEIVAEVK